MKRKCKRIAAFYLAVIVSVANIKISCNKKNVDKVVLATAGIPSDSDRERFEEIANVGNVVVCEKTKISQFNDMVRFNEICRNQASEILGAVVL